MEYMVIPKDVSITDLYSVDNIYSEQLKGEYQKFKKEQPDIELSESDYLVSTLNPRYFSYDSLYEQQMHIENVRNYLLLGTTIVASIFCPPVILTTMGFIFGALEVGSAIGGRDYLTNRKMDKNERIFRGIFGAMDMLPGVVAITKQFEPGRKLISAISDLKVKSINFVKDTYSLGKTKLNAAYNSMLTKIDDFENAIIRQLDDVFVGNSQLRPAFAGIPSDLGDDVVRNVAIPKHILEESENVLNDVYFGDLMSPEEAIRYDDYWKNSGIGSDETWKQYQKLFPDSSLDDYLIITKEQSPWPIGYEPEEVVLHPGDRINMVISKKDIRYTQKIGGFGLLEEVPDAKFVRQNLAIKEEWKSPPFVQVTFKVKDGVELHALKGPIGPQIDLPAGKVYPGDMSLTQFDLFGLYKKIERTDYLERIPGSIKYLK